MIETPTIVPDQRTTRDWIGLVARLVLGGALFVAGASKVANLGESVLAVRGYQLNFIPYELQKMIGYGLPIFEVLLGLLILLGVFTRVSAAVGTLLMLVFIAGISSAWARGLSIDCGCFGGGGETDNPKYLQEILRDTAFVLCGAWLVWRPRTPFSLDNWIFRPITTHSPTLDSLTETDDLDASVREEDPR